MKFGPDTGMQFGVTEGLDTAEKARHRRLLRDHPQEERLETLLDRAMAKVKTIVMPPRAVPLPLEVQPVPDVPVVIETQPVTTTSAPDLVGEVDLPEVEATTPEEPVTLEVTREIEEVTIPVVEEPVVPQRMVFGPAAELRLEDVVTPTEELPPPIVVEETPSRWKRNVFIGAIAASGIAGAAYWLLS